MNRFSSRARLVISAEVVFALVPSVHAEVLVSNLAEPYRSATPIGNNPNPAEPPGGGPWYWATQSFMTDSVEQQLVSIELFVGDGSIDPAPTVIARLHADHKGEVGDLIATLMAPNVFGAQSARMFMPDEPFPLQPETPYWLVLGSLSPGDGTYFWGYANSNQSDGPGGLLGWAYSDDSGATWVIGQKFPYLIQVNVAYRYDTDGDNVDDTADVCCNTPPGVPVDAFGRPIGDFDLDCDNDLDDYAIYSRGFTGPLSGPVDCCSGGRTNCEGICIDTSSDMANCGKCGNVCDPGFTCEFGSCESCPKGQSFCHGACHDLRNDNTFCGTTCHNARACTVSQTCINGACQP